MIVSSLIPLAFFSLAISLGQQPAATPDAALAAAHQMLSSGEYAQADAALHSYVATHPLSADGKYLLAYTLFREDKPKESLAAYTDAARLRTPAPADLFSVGLDYVLLNDFADANKWVTQAVNGMQDNEDVWYSLGRIKYTLNRFTEAEHCFEKALSLSPRDVRAENNLGLTYEGLNETDQAIAAYHTAMAWQQDSPHPSEQPMINLAIVLLERDQNADALSLLKQANSISPHDPKIHTQLGRAYLAQGNLPQAQTELEQAVQLAPNNAGTHFQLGQVYRRQGETEKAKAEFARAAALDGTHSSDKQ